jgi:DNA topoisomerase-1
LGSDYKVLASFGHIRDLPSKDGAVKPDDDFSMVWDVDARAASKIKDIAAAMKGADKLILATDPDREGEAISWHILEVLKEKNVLGKIRSNGSCSMPSPNPRSWKPSPHPRALNEDWSMPIWPAGPWTIWSASPCRRAVAQAAGRTLGRPRAERGAAPGGRARTGDRGFRAQEYLEHRHDLAAATGNFSARLIQLDAKRLKSFRSPTKRTRRALSPRSTRRNSPSPASKPSRSSATPSPPFITSSLQQEASRKLGFNAKRTMQIAQGLYEGVEIGGDVTGLITYMPDRRITMVGEAINEAREVIGKKYGAKYVPSAARVYVSKAKNAQEAHEAVRPTSFARTPEEVARYLDADAAKLYELIWKRAVASQMESAEQERTTVDVVSGDKQITLRATGTVTLFDGFLTLYQEGQDDSPTKMARGCRNWRQRRHQC